MTFLYPVFLQLGAGVALLIILGFASHARRRRRLANFLGGRRGAGRVSASNLYRLRTERILLLVVAVLALAGATAEPSWLGGGGGVTPPQSRTSVVLAIDVSASMQATDLFPTRLAQAVRVAGEVLERAEGTRVGLLLFAGKGYTLAPPTEDIEALAFLLRGVTPTIVSAQDPGSLLSAGIRDASTLLSAREGTGARAVVLISDGEAGEPDEEIAAAVRDAGADGVSVYTVGVGTLRGDEMALPRGTYQMGGPVLDVTGAPGISRLQEPLLQRIAQEGGGEYARAEDGAALRRMYQALRPTARQQMVGPDLTGLDLTLVLASAGLLLLLLDSLLEIPTRGRRMVPSRRES